MVEAFDGEENTVFLQGSLRGSVSCSLRAAPQPVLEQGRIISSTKDGSPGRQTGQNGVGEVQFPEAHAKYHVVSYLQSKVIPAVFT